MAKKASTIGMSQSVWNERTRRILARKKADRKAEVRRIRKTTTLLRESCRCLEYIDHKYKKVWMPEHPRANDHGFVFEHVVVLEQKIGRPLEKHEVGHHIDGNSLNNQPDNLKEMTKGNHAWLHRRMGSELTKS